MAEGSAGFIGRLVGFVENLVGRTAAGFGAKQLTRAADALSITAEATDRLPAAGHLTNAAAIPHIRLAPMISQPGCSARDLRPAVQAMFDRGSPVLNGNETAKLRPRGVAAVDRLRLPENHAFLAIPGHILEVSVDHKYPSGTSSALLLFQQHQADPTHYLVVICLPDQLLQPGEVATAFREKLGIDPGADIAMISRPQDVPDQYSDYTLTLAHETEASFCDYPGYRIGNLAYGSLDSNTGHVEIAQWNREALQNATEAALMQRLEEAHVGITNPAEYPPECQKLAAMVDNLANPNTSSGWPLQPGDPEALNKIGISSKSRDEILMSRPYIFGFSLA